MLQKAQLSWLLGVYHVAYQTFENYTCSKNFLLLCYFLLYLNKVIYYFKTSVTFTKITLCISLSSRNLYFLSCATTPLEGGLYPISITQVTAGHTLTHLTIALTPYSQ